MDERYTQEIESFVTACRSAAAHGLIQCSSGNLSCRLEHEQFLVSGSGFWMERISPSQIARCQLPDGQRLEGPRPTVEIAFHAGILQKRRDVNVVLHFQSPFATVLACCTAPQQINYAVIPEIPVNIGNIGYIPYRRPGSEELAESVVSVMQAHNLGVMDHHGLVVVGKDYDQAIQNAVFFELACQIIVRGGKQTTPLTEAALRDLPNATPCRMS